MIVDFLCGGTCRSCVTFNLKTVKRWKLHVVRSTANHPSLYAYQAEHTSYCHVQSSKLGAGEEHVKIEIAGSIGQRYVSFSSK